LREGFDNPWGFGTRSKLCGPPLEDPRVSDRRFVIETVEAAYAAARAARLWRFDERFVDRGLVKLMKWYLEL
jgi:hypothetical protein